MSWLKDLYDTYQANLREVGRYDRDGRNPLLPVAHKLESTQVVITIDLEGKFVDARASDLRDTIIPCSEDSQSRTSGIAAHPLVDGLSYLAKDFAKYATYKNHSPTQTCRIGSKKCQDCKNHERYRSKQKDYLSNLKLWKDSPFCHPFILAVYRYINAETLMNDLFKNKILFLDETQRLANSWTGKTDDKPPIFKILSNYSQKKQGDILIRWIVSHNGLNHLWESEEIHESWTAFVKSNAKSKGYCFITGEETVLSSSSPRDIRKSGDGAKIISANDHDNYTYKGRFEKKQLNQVATLGLEANHASHAVLKWLIKRQGYNSYDTFALVAWGINSPSVPQPLDEDDNLFADNQTEYFTDTDEGYGRIFSKRIAGYSKKLSDRGDQIIILAIDAPIKDKGRTSIVHYSKHTPSDYFTKIQDWHTRAAWRHRSSKTKEFFLGAPSPKRIAEACFERKVNEKGKDVWKTDPKAMSRTIKRILPCIISSVNIPPDIINTVIHRTNNKAAFKKSEYFKWEQILAVACSLYKHSKKEKITMSLDHSRNTRDYLYGRLLAIADCLEGFAHSQQGFDHENTDQREYHQSRATNAARLMARFAQRPYETWPILKAMLLPYERRLGAKTAKYDVATEEVMNLFEPEEFKKTDKLSGEYLLGYYCQRSELKIPSK